MGTENIGVAASMPWAHLRLPPFPQVALGVLQLVGKEDVSLQHLCELISSDPTFAREVLRVANSVSHARRYPSNSIQRAAAVLGARKLQGICITVGIRSYLGKAMVEPTMRHLWRHDLACALIAERLGSLGLEDKNIAYTAGILHDLGRIALAMVRPRAYAALLDEYRGAVEGILDAERELFGVDHCETVLQLVEDWGLPEMLAPAVAEHHSARRTDGAWNATELIKVSCRMANAVGFPAFAGCATVEFDNVLKELPARERRLFSADADKLSEEIAQGIRLIEQA